MVVHMVSRMIAQARAKVAGPRLEHVDLCPDPLQSRAVPGRIGPLIVAKPGERPAQVAKGEDHVLDQKEFKSAATVHVATPSYPKMKLAADLLRSA